MNREIRKNAKNDFGKDFFKVMNNVVFERIMANVRKHGYIKHEYIDCSNWSKKELHSVTAN